MHAAHVAGARILLERLSWITGLTWQLQQLAVTARVWRQQVSVIQVSATNHIQPRGITGQACQHQSRRCST